jgi:uncharacterized circularly permuted ATP-grasp superfamily protein/uncharacterized alpha-E superfamily protein
MPLTMDTPLVEQLSLAPTTEPRDAAIAQAEAGALPYAPTAGIYDEMIGPDGQVRPHWQRLRGGLQNIGADGMTRRWERGKRLLRANGVTYNVYGDPLGTVRQWRLDPVPMVIEGADWQRLELALQQRATLLNAILDDIYGPQALMRSGLLPPAVIHANPAFLRSLVGWREGGAERGPCLHFYSADLARSPDGLWWVIGDRAEAPSGTGYTLENRSIISRVLPDLYRQCGVERLAPWFTKARESLAARAPLNRDDPCIILLTPGPYNETWFEHAYLARTLGLLLVEGEDLTVRDGRVMLKTTEGLKSVDVILRRTDGAYCDPLELRSDSTLGVPGLVEAVHRNTVSICNGLGSGVVESPVMMAFLPSLCRVLLGEELMMPSVATWWCGQKPELEYVIANLDRLALRPAFSVATPLVRGEVLSAEERQKWIDRLRANPALWVAQEAVDLSTAPQWKAGSIQPRPVVMRAHCCASDGSYAVMPGGLTRTGISPRELSVSMQQGGGSKDTWVLSVPSDQKRDLVSSHGETFFEVSPTAPNLQGFEPRELGRSEPTRLLAISRGQIDLPSRVADHMFWLGRYLERCENTCRLLRGVLTRALAGPDAAAELTVALSLFQRMAHLPLGLDVIGGAEPDAEDGGPVLSAEEAHERAVDRLLTVNLDPTIGHALAGTIQNLQRASTVARDRLSIDTWRTLGSLPGLLEAIVKADALDPDDVAAALDDIITTLSALSGLAQESMTRGLGWRFMDIGRRIERGLHMLDLLDATQITPTVSVSAALELALDVSDSQMTYRARYPSPPRFLPCLDLLLADETNPRSLGFQIERLMEHMEMLAPDRVHRIFTAEHRLVISIQATVRTLSLDRVQARGHKGVTIDAVTATVREDLYLLVDALMRRYFVHAAEQRHPHRIALVHPKPTEAPSDGDDDDVAEDAS